MPVIKILRPLFPLRQFLYPFLIICTVLLVCFYLCLKIGFLAYFSLVLSKGGFILGGRALSYLFIKMGCSGGLTLAILFAVRVLLSTGAAPSLGNMVLPAGAESGPSTAFPKLEWEVALDLPSQSGGA